MEAAFMLTLLGVAAIIVAAYYVGTLALNIVNCYRERDRLRKILDEKKTLYSRNGQRTLDAMEQIRDLREQIADLEFTLKSERDFSAELVASHNVELKKRDNTIATLNRQLMFLTHERRNTTKEAKTNG